MSDYEKTQRRHNTIVGLFVVLGIVALIWLISKFGDLPSFVSELDSFEVYIQFPTAPGVQKDTPIQFCGYQIGRVTQVQAPEKRPDLKTGEELYQTVVLTRIDNKYKTIPSNVDVKMMMRGLGSSYIELKQRPDLPLIRIKPDDPNSVFLTPGIFLQGSTGMTSEFFPEESQEKLSELIDGIKIFIDNSNKIIGDPQNQSNFNKTLANLTDVTEQAKATLNSITNLSDSATSTLEHTELRINEIVNAANDTSKDIREFVNAGTDVIKNTDKKTDELTKSLLVTVEELGKTSAQLRLVMEKVNTGQGTISKFINDPLLYNKLVDDTKQLDEVLTSMKALIDKIEEKGLSKVWSGSK